VIRAALVAAEGSTAAAARALGVTRVQLDRRITALGLRPWLAETYPAGRRPHLAGPSRST
jgi:ABC-type Fe3+ transport system permease subunit